MSIRFLMDVHVSGPITRGLRRRGIDVLTAQEDGSSTLPDPKLLDRALALGRVVFTQDSDFLAEASSRQADNREFAGVIYCRQRALPIGAYIEQLELIASVYDPPDMLNRVEWLPLR